MSGKSSRKNPRKTDAGGAEPAPRRGDSEIAPPRGRPETAPRRGRPAGDREARRAELLQAAMSVIADEGYAGASLRKVAERAGCTTGTVTYYFADKEEMVTAVVQGLFDIFDALLAEHDDYLDVATVFGRWVDRTRKDDSVLWLVLFQLLAHARHEPAFVDVIRKRYASFRHTFTSILERGQKEGDVRRDIPADLLADQLSAMSDGWMMMFPLEPERFTPKRVKALLDAVVKLISPGPSAGRKSVER